MSNTPNLVKTGSKIAFETTLATTIDSDDTTIELTSADGLPTSNFSLILDYDVSTKREAVSIESRTGTTLTVYTDGRGYDGTTATSHTGGTCKVRATILPIQLDNLIDKFKEEHDDDGKHTVDEINEKTTGAGVTVDGVLLKDGMFISTTNPACRIIKSTVQSILSATYTTIQYNTIEYDKDNNYDTSTYKFTAPINGIYNVSASILLATTTWTEGKTTHLDININGSGYCVLYRYECEASEDKYIHLHGNTDIPLSKDDYIEIIAHQNNGSSINIYPNLQYNYFTCRLVQ